MQGYIQQERLHWDTITASSELPFSNPTDYKVLYNDWPYFVDERIKHLVVWTKFLIDEDDTTERLTKEANDRVEEFIRKTFCEGAQGETVDREQIVWFKNWKSLKSVRALGKSSRPPEMMLDLKNS